MSEMLFFMDYLNITHIFFYLCILNMQGKKIFSYGMFMAVYNKITSSMKHQIWWALLEAFLKYINLPF